MSTAPVSTDQPTSAPNGECATTRDVQKLFVSEMTNLFQLALLLTVDGEKAENCILRSIHKCLESDPISKQRLPGWIRNTVIRNGIKLVKGDQGDSLSEKVQCDQIHSAHGSLQCAIADYSAGILELSEFDRLVYVICILENYPTPDCAELLGRSQHEVSAARNRALAHIAEFESTWRCLA